MGEFNRRSVLAASAALAATSGAAFAQAPRPKGPLVWLDLDQQELDDAYDQSKYAANLQQIVKRYATNSEAVRKRLGNPARLAYGATPIEGLDLYPARGRNAPIHVFIHGGRGAADRPRIPPIRPKHSCARARTTSRSISTTWSRPRAT